jgi:TolA-binding protein
MNNPNFDPLAALHEMAKAVTYQSDSIISLVDTFNQQNIRINNHEQQIIRSNQQLKHVNQMINHLRLQNQQLIAKLDAIIGTPENDS